MIIWSNSPYRKQRPHNKDINQSPKSAQPKIYTAPNPGNSNLIYQAVAGIIFSSSLTAFILLEKQESIFTFLDLYKDKHNYILSQPMILQKTSNGGLLSLMLLSLTIIVIGSIHLKQYY